MAGSVVDLSAYDAILPRSLVVDTPLIVAQFLHASYSPLPLETAREARFFRLAIATLDRDFQRAQADFDVYTWL